MWEIAAGGYIALLVLKSPDHHFTEIMAGKIKVLRRFVPNLIKKSYDPEQTKNYFSPT